MPETEDGVSPVGESGKGTHRGLKITLLSLAAGGLIAGLVLALVSQLERPYFSPPDEPREWAREKYESTLLGASAVKPQPTLSSYPPQSITQIPEAGKLTVEVDRSLGNSNPIGELFETFTADENGEVVLPTGNRLKLSAVSVVMPEDLSGEESGGGMATLNWQDPETLERLPVETGPDWETEKWVQAGSPELFLKVSNEGGKSIRWLGVEAYDERTLIKVQSGYSFRTHEKEGEFGTGLDIWHQTPLMIAVQFSFGDPEFREIELKPEAEVRFGDEGLVRVLAVTPRAINSSGSSYQPSPPRAQKFFRYPTAPDSRRRDDRRGVVFHVWPAHNEKLIDFVFEEKKGKNGTAERFLSAWGNDGITQADFPDPDTLVSVKARRMPRIGRAVFRLSRVPRLPETDNLFNTPITRVKLSYRSEMEEIIGRSTGVQLNGGGTRISDTHFPMVLEDTTPVEILRLNERLAGRRLFFDRKELKLSATRLGVMEDFKQWWQRNKFRWLP